MNGHELAQINVARMRDSLDSATMRGFLDVVDPMVRLAEQVDGFIWRLATEGHAVATHGDLVVNVSVWRSYESLHDFVYRSHHGGLVRRRSEWFGPTPQPSTALWWVPPGHRPSVDEALRRLAVFERYGPSPRAFGLRHRFEPDGRRAVRTQI